MFFRTILAFDMVPPSNNESFTPSMIFYGAGKNLHPTFWYQGGFAGTEPRAHVARLGALLVHICRFFRTFSTFCVFVTPVVVFSVITNLGLVTCG